MKPITAGLPPSTNWPIINDNTRDTHDTRATESRPYTLPNLGDPTHPDAIAANQEHAMNPSSPRPGKTRAQVLAEAKAGGLVTFGEQDYPPTRPATGPGKSRDQVRAELAQAKADGLVTFGEQDYPPTRPATEPGKSRDQVRAELAQAKADGLVTFGEQDYPPTRPATGPGKSRDQVRAELAQAKADGLVTFGEQDYPPTPTSSRSGKTPTLDSPEATRLQPSRDDAERESILDKLRNAFKGLWGPDK